MRYVILLSVLTSMLPLATMAQSVANAPIILEKNTAKAPAITTSGSGFSNFPEAAITRVGENTTGQHMDVPATPASPVAPAHPVAAPAPGNPANPASPPAPANPISPLWPRDTVEIFMPSCVGLHVQFIAPCTCVITQLMLHMPHDEFLKKSEDGTIEQDARLKKIRTDCATAPQKKD